MPVSRNPVTRRDFLKSVAGAAIATSVIGRSQLSTWGQSTVKIGLLWLTEAKEGLMRGANFAASVINEGLGLTFPSLAGAGLPNLDARIELVEGSSVDQLASAGVAAIVGGALSDQGQRVAAAAAAAQKAGIPFFDVADIESFLTRQGNDHYFRLPPNNLQNAKLTLAAIADRRGKDETPPPESFTYLVADRPGLDFDAEVLQRFANDPLETGDPADAFQAMNLVAVKPDADLAAIASGVDTEAVFFDGLTPEQVATAMRTFLRQNKRPALIFVDPYTSVRQGLNNILTQEEQQGWRWLFSDVLFLEEVYNADADFAPDLGEFRAKYEEVTGVKMDVFSALGFTGVEVASIYLNEAGSTDAADIIATVNESEVDLGDLIVAWNGIQISTTSFGDAGQNILALPLVARLDDEGALQVVELPGGITPSGFFLAYKIKITIINLLCTNILCGL